MRHSVLTLIAAAPTPLDAVVDGLRSVLHQLGARLVETDWLAPGTACDIAFTGLDPDQGDAAAHRLLTDEFPGVPLDVVVQPPAGRRKLLLLADLESTIIENEMLDELAEFLGLHAEVAEITRQAMNDEIDFAAALDARVAILKGLPETMLAEASSRVRVTPGAAALVATMRANGAMTALVSGGFSVFAEPVRQRLGFDRAIANELELADGRLAGTVRRPLVTSETKLASLKTLAVEHGVGLAATLAVGDGANDLAMLEAAGLGIAFRAKPMVAARVRARIDHGDLTALLYAQGYRAGEIVAG